ncbi:MAG: type IV pilus secretin family protein, partial [Gammaproteobacteria bacterium]
MKYRLSLALIGLLLWASQSLAAGNALEEITYAKLPGDQVQLVLRFREPPKEPLAFTIADPARIALDFPDTRLAVKKRKTPIGVGVTRSVTAVEGRGRTRVVINQSELSDYQTRVKGNQVIVHIGPPQTAATASSPAPEAIDARLAQEKQTAPAQNRIESIDFRRGTRGEARIILKLSNPRIPVDVRQQARDIVVEALNTGIDEKLQRRMDVTDFATPVESIDTFQVGNDVRIVVRPTGDYEQLAYQADDIFTIEVKPLTKAEVERRKKKEFTGERLSLNFQDIEVRSVLQLIADFTNLNVVVSDSVSGNLTLRLKNVPWDQALDIILKTKGLAMRQNGNVLLIAPAAEIAAQEKLELEANKQVEELAPLRSEFIQINYANASELAALLKSKGNSLLSERGNVTIDNRTNTLLVQDTDAKLEEIRRLIARLDVPVRQVLIESRIVEASDKYTKELGVRFGITSQGTDTSKNLQHAVSGTAQGAYDFTQGNTPSSLDAFGAYNVNLPVANPAGSIGLSLIKLPMDLMLNLELS